MRIKIFIIFFMTFLYSDETEDRGHFNQPLMINKTSDYQLFNGYIYKKPKPFTFLTSLPNDLKEYSQIVFDKSYLKEFTGLALVTGALIYFDEDLIKKSRFMHDDLGISYVDKMQVLAEPFNQPIRVPSDLGSMLYFIGDGWTHLGVSISFYTVGKIKNDNRALQTSSQILQGMFSAGFVTQVLKHITGRVSPFKSIDFESYSSEEFYNGNTDVHDRWEFFPNQITYHKYVSSYDAYPSGHLAVFMSTLTIISENYSEYKFIKPVGYTLMTLLGLQMMNNGVHWASDYPLSIAMGYYLGKIAVNNGRQGDNKSASLNYKLIPYYNPNEIGVNLIYKFN
tara:strand:+ start:908 stop:1921 length:1014 start_codon:yes stop_codon:yes gene_type:complete